LILVGVGLLLGAIQHYLPVLHNVPTNPLGELASGGPGDAVMLGLVAVVAGGLREELQRAFLLRRFEEHLGGTWVGVIVLSAAFGLGHLLQGWDAVVATSALGAGWAVLYVWRRSSVAPIVSHAGFNAIEVLQMATLSG
jgi:membrane protease YdiL (CAAX protease family)